VARTLREDLRRQSPLPAQRCVEVGLGLASALAHLHKQSLIHRDIKPSNIIFIQGAPKLADIGLVTEAGDSRSIVGTEGYLPPEGPGTPQADIFSLGKVLYEISTGQDRRQFPDLPPDLKQSPDAAAVLELNEVVLRACAKDAQQRYATADQMQADLERLAHGTSVRRRYKAHRRWRLVRRASIWLGAGAAALSLILFAIRLRPLPDDEPAEKGSTNEAANASYELGIAYLDKLFATNTQMAAHCFDEATKADPNFAEAWAWLAWTETWHTEDFNPDSKSLGPKAQEHAKRALSLKASLAIPHLVLGAYAASLDWNWDEDAREKKRALKLGPRSARVRAAIHYNVAEGLRMRGDMTNALKALDMAQKLDPRSVTYAMRRAGFLRDAKQFGEALTQLKTVSVLAPEFDLSYARASALCGLSNYVDAVQALREAKGPPNPERDRELAELAEGVSTNGASAWWRWELRNATQKGDRYRAARAYAQLRETNAAITNLQADLKDKMWRLPFSVMTDWPLDPVRSDPRFQKIVNDIGFK
jgi:tetratricopeptide (TPR) repeat protein